VMAERGRAPGLFILLAIVLLVGSLGVAGWFFFVPKSDPKPPLRAEDLAVVCTGRVDTPQMVISLDPSMPGRVIEVFVKEGDEVQADQPILKMDDSIAVHRRMQAEAAVTAAAIDRDRAKAEAERFPDTIRMRRALVAAAAAQVTAAEKTVDVQKALAGVQKPGEAQIAALEANVRQLKELQKAEEIGLEQLVTAEKDKFADLAVAAADARLQAAEADLELARKAEKECVLLAPARGHILRLQATKGGTLTPGYLPAVVFAPAGKRIVRAEVDQEYLAKVKEGQAAEVSDDSRLDSPVWRGKVKSVSKWVAQRRTLILEPGEVNDVRTLEAVIELTDDDHTLVIGQRMRITIKVK
jgi:multidrug resistance efflux pump